MIVSRTSPVVVPSSCAAHVDTATSRHVNAAATRAGGRVAVRDAEACGDEGDQRFLPARLLFQVAGVQQR